MLTYHPAFDLYNAIFRNLRILDRLKDRVLEVERVRILDFYLLFPFLLGEMQFPQSAKKFKKHFAEKPSDYENISDPKRLFLRLEPYQLAALNCLASYSIIEPEAFRDGKVKRTATQLPVGLQAAIDDRNLKSVEIEMLSGPLVDVDLYGKSGLRQKSDLFECRYDPK